LRAVRAVGDGRVGVEPGYVARYVVAVALAAAVALAFLAFAPAAVAAVAAAAAFGGASIALRLVPSELMALVPGR